MRAFAFCQRFVCELLKHSDNRRCCIIRIACINTRVELCLSIHQVQLSLTALLTVQIPFRRVVIA